MRVSIGDDITDRKIDSQHMSDAPYPADDECVGICGGCYKKKYERAVAELATKNSELADTRRLRSQQKQSIDNANRKIDELGPVENHRELMTAEQA